MTKVFVEQPQLHHCCLRTALLKLVQLQYKSLMNKNMPSLMVYVYKNQCQLFHMSNGIICVMCPVLHVRCRMSGVTCQV